jgi:hypothetical protein
MSIGKIAEFNPASEDLETYLERLELYFDANDIKSEKKPVILLQLVGAGVYKTLKSLLSPVLPKDRSYDQLVKQLKSHYLPVKSVIVECFTFNKRHQNEGESINGYAVELQRLASTCDFGTFLDRALRDRFIGGGEQRGC